MFKIVTNYLLDYIYEVKRMWYGLQPLHVFLQRDNIDFVIQQLMYLIYNKLKLNGI